MKRLRIERQKINCSNGKPNNKTGLVKIGLTFSLAFSSFHLTAQAAAPVCPLKPAFSDVLASVDALAAALSPYTTKEKCKESAEMARNLRAELGRAAVEIRRYETERYNRAAVADNKPQIKMNPYDYQNLMTNVSRVGDLALNFDCMDSMEARFPLFAALTNTINVLSPYLTIYGGPNGGAVVGINSLASVLGRVVIEVMKSKEPRKMDLTKERNIFIDSSCSFLQFSRTVGQIGAIPQTLPETQERLILLEKELRELEQNTQDPHYKAYQDLSQRQANIDQTSGKILEIDKILQKTYQKAETVNDPDYGKALTAQCVMVTGASAFRGQEFNSAGKLLSQWYFAMAKIESANKISGSPLGLTLSTLLSKNGEDIVSKSSLTIKSPVKALEKCGLDFKNWRENYLLLGAVVSQQFSALGHLISDQSGQKTYNELLTKKKDQIKEAKDLIAQLKVYKVSNTDSPLSDPYYSAVSEINLALTQFKDNLFKSVDGLFWGYVGKVYSPAERFLSLKIGDALDRLNENDSNDTKISAALSYLNGLVTQSVDIQNENEDETDKRNSACHSLRTAKNNLLVAAAHLNSFGLYCATFKNIVTDDTKYKEYKQLCFPDSTQSIRLTTEMKSIDDVRARYKANRSQEKINQYQGLLDHAVCESAKPEYRK